MKQEETEPVLNSLDGLKPATPGTFLYDRIVQRICEVKKEYTPLKIVWLAAASFLVLLLLNFTVLRGNGHRSEAIDTQEIAAGYHLLNNNMINYNE